MDRTSLRPARAPNRNFLSALDFDAPALELCLELAAQLKQERSMRRRAPTARHLAGYHVALLFDKPSLRTRATFEIAVHELGGDLVVLPPDVTFGGRESLGDVAKNLERWVDIAVLRTSAHDRVLEFAAAAPRLHAVNALTDEQHPCQALADLLTLREHWGEWRERTIAFVGDGNNVATSLAQSAPMLGTTLHIASPEGYELPASVVEDGRRRARFGAKVRLFRDAADAVRGADAVYTDVWTSMGQESESALRRSRFKDYQVTSALMGLASSDALFLHCLPAHRGDEVTDEVLDSPQCVVFDQAENRLHTEKALLITLTSES